MKKYYNYVTLLLVMLCAITSNAQDFSNKGKEFWISYSYHVGMANGASPTMTLYITSDVNTNFTVEAFGAATIQSGSIAAGQVISVIIPTTYFINNEGKFTGRAIRVLTDKNSVVYSYITRSAVSGATVCLPTQVLGKEYYSANFTQISNETNSNSFFTVIAVEDNTVVEITPSANTKNGWSAGTPYQVTLNKGEIYQVLGTVNGTIGSDLTGSFIKSIASGTSTCKRIAVFSGSGKVSIGCPSPSSSDNLYQQLYPTVSWGLNYLTVPSYNRPNNYYRIIRKSASTNVYLNGNLIPGTSFTNGRYFEFLNNTPNKITADEPISVIQYFTTQGCQGNGSPYDPDMIVLNPVEQNINNVTLVSSNLVAAGPQHHLHAIMKNGGTGISSFKLDGSIVSPSLWFPHPSDPNFSYLYLANVNQGFHTLSSDSGFNALAYGYAAAESYGYSAGANVKDLYQFVSIQNKEAIVNYPATCKGSPFKFSMTFPYQPLELSWKFNGLFNDTTVNSPVYDSTWVLNGRNLYRYNLPGNYVVSNIGLYPIKVLVKNPTSSDGCTGEQEIDYEIEVFNPPSADFTFINNGCLSDSVKFTNTSNNNGRGTIKWFWDFDDGTSSLFPSPTKLFTAPKAYNVKFSMINDIGCLSDTAMKIVTLFDPPVAKYLIQSPPCIGKIITFKDSSYTPTGSTLIKWTWNFGDGSPVIVSTNNASQSHVYATTGNYDISLIVESATGCKSLVYKQTVTIGNFPKADFSIPNICLPSGTANFNNLSTLTGGTLTYLWDFGNSTSSTVKDPVATYTTTGPFNVKLTATSNNGCIHDTTKIVNTVFAEPISNFSAPTEVCLGDSAVFTNLSNAPGSTIVEWNWNFGDGTLSTLQNPSAKTYSSAGTYTVTLRVKSAIGCFSPVFSKNVVVNPLPTPQFSIGTLSCEKQQVNFINSSVANAGNITTWNWNFKDGDLKTYNTGNSFTKVYDTAGNYDVLLEVITDKGCKNSLTKNVRVNTLPRSNFVSPKVCLDDAFAFFTNTTTIADGTTASLLYNWNFGDQNSTPANNISTDKDPSHKYSQLGVYAASLTVTSRDGCVKDTVRSFTVNGSTPKASFNVLNDLGLCSNTLAQIQNTSTVAFGSITDVKIKWDLVGAPGIDSIDAVPTPNKIYSTKYPDFQNPLTKNYSVRLYSYSGSSCVDSAFKVLTINASPKVIMQTIPGICNEASPRLITQGSEIGGVPGTFIYRCTNITPAGMFDPKSLAPNNYDIEYVFTSDKGCRDSITKPIAVWPSPVAYWSYSSLNCEKNAVTFTDSSAANYSNIINWKWDFGTNGPAPVNLTTGSPFNKTFTTYAAYNVGLQVFTDSGCQSIVNTKLLTIHPLPRVNFKIPEVCLPAGRGQFLDQSTIPAGTTSTFKFNWNFGDGGSNSVLKDPFYTFSNVGPYDIKLIVTSEFNCVDSTVIKDTTIYPQPKADFSVDKLEACLGSTFSFRDLSNGKTSPLNTWKWNLGDNNTSTIPNPINKYAKDGTYIVSLFVYNQQGCVSDTIQKTIIVHPYPTVDAGKDLFVLEGGQLTLNPIATGNDLLFKWTPPLYLDSDTLKNPITKPLDDITYVITVTGRGGCSVNDDVYIKVLLAPEMPNVFSPNGDGINDFWEIKYLESYPGTTVEIYNRYGQLIFRSVGYNKPWDGTFKGKQVPAGTYYYIVNPKNGRKQIAGFVDVIR